MKRQLWPQTGKAIILILSLLAYGFIGYKLWHFTHWKALVNSVQLSGDTLILCVLLLALWFLNLLCETKKWQVLMAPFKSLSLKESWQQVMAGTTTAVGSPARIAEMGGRMALLPAEQRTHAAIITTVGGLFQNTVILLSGAFTFLFNSEITDRLNLPLHHILVALVCIALFTTLLILAAICHKKLRFYLRIIQNIPINTLLKALFWTSMRYLIYIIQLYSWLWLYGLQYSTGDFVALATIYFLSITIIPSHILIDMGIRGSVAIFLFSSADVDTPLVLAAIFSLWISNVVIPTLFGSYVLIRQKLIKQAVMQKEV
ncbi:hypothetical protein KDU71_21930 [Carboxylicivirga sediminis]|uniref:Uncharacterized protein n=1 Tax=Carboxylicivirga sediminis TaxID=2006564 RepID=A0A941F8I5_9BACT|nr:hypothetical protein [Carboxylicivirga sediminis]MBR8538247.1 hypothetical protein [Carboxylicivirga sediminis]